MQGVTLTQFGLALTMLAPSTDARRAMPIMRATFIVFLFCRELLQFEGVDALRFASLTGRDTYHEFSALAMGSGSWRESS